MINIFNAEAFQIWIIKMIGTQITQTKPEGASFHEPSATQLRHIRDTYLIPQKMTVEITNNGNSRTVKYNFISEEARAEYEADPVIIEMLQSNQQHNTSANVVSNSTEVV
jgi:hypothetical protein